MVLARVVERIGSVCGDDECERPRARSVACHATRVQVRGARSRNSLDVERVARCVDVEHIRRATRECERGIRGAIDRVGRGTVVHNVKQ